MTEPDNTFTDSQGTFQRTLSSEPGPHPVKYLEKFIVWEKLATFPGGWEAVDAEMTTRLDSLYGR